MTFYIGQTLSYVWHCILGMSKKEAEQYCGSVEDGENVGHPYAMRGEHYTIMICRNLKGGLQEIWPKLKHWN